MKPYDGCGQGFVIAGLSVICAVLLHRYWWIVPALYAGGTLINVACAKFGKRQS